MARAIDWSTVALEGRRGRVASSRSLSEALTLASGVTPHGLLTRRRWYPMRSVLGTGALRPSTAGSEVSGVPVEGPCGPANPPLWTCGEHARANRWRQGPETWSRNRMAGKMPPALAVLAGCPCRIRLEA